MKTELQQNYHSFPSAALQILSDPTPVSSVTLSTEGKLSLFFFFLMDAAIQRTDGEIHCF